ncbi:hypothetical protein SAMN02910358_02638 [Lachnospiraceae bacterium XBB1006]|nr:hypothetical protein SAMN02910358_02638 [Lachnospiraceae bacterium XBB1006]
MDSSYHFCTERRIMDRCPTGRLQGDGFPVFYYHRLNIEMCYDKKNFQKGLTSMAEMAYNFVTQRISRNCALFASCDRETYTNEYYIRDG